jgi:putative transposase
VARWIQERFQVSCVRACRLGGLSRAAWYRKSTAKDQAGLRMRIRELALSRPRFGYLRIHVLLGREGWKVNRKRVHRLYRLEGLQVRMRGRRRKRLSLHRGPAPRPSALGERWSMDFVHDQLANGRAFRVLTVVDNWSRESVALEAGFRLTGDSVAMALARASLHRTLPRSITVDHGTEFTSRVLDQWAWENGVQLDFTRPGKPTDNGLCESFNGRLRDECLNVNEFESIDHARQQIEAWRLDYNEQRPHGALGRLTPSEFANAGRKAAPEVAELQLKTVC